METKDFVKGKIEELKSEVEAVKSKLGAEANEFVGDLEDKIEDVLAEVDAELHEEIEEFKEVGLVAWVKANQGKFWSLVGLVALAANGALAVLGLHFHL